MMYNLIKSHLKYPNKLTDTYFLSKVMQGQAGIIPGLPSMGRIGKDDYVKLIKQAMLAYEREFKALDFFFIEELMD
jgi:hypothetical protein